MLSGSRLLLWKIPTALHGRMYATGSRSAYRHLPQNYGGRGYVVSPELMRNPNIIECVNLAAEDYNNKENKKLEFVDMVNCHVRDASGRTYWFTSLFKDETGDCKRFIGGVLVKNFKRSVVYFAPAPTHQKGFDFADAYKAIGKIPQI